MTAPRTFKTQAVGDIYGSTQRVVAAVAAGQPVIVVDDMGGTAEGSLVIAAELVTTSTMAFMVRHTSGFICVALTARECDRLNLPPMSGIIQNQRCAEYSVTVDAAHETTTGISARDRAVTTRVLADPGSQASDLVRPGHVVTLRTQDGGVAVRGGHAEAAVDLARLARLSPVGVLSELVSIDDPRRMACGSELAHFAEQHGLHMISVVDLADYCRASESRVTEGGLVTIGVDR
jgi:3,4-dihydroxy 2-butanone 4-phosphate synthase/GTP cyclohydrolase II